MDNKAQASRAAQNTIKKAVTTTILVAMATGCAGPNQAGYGASWQPVVDVRPEQQAAYTADLAQCQAYATQVMSSQQAAMTGALAGAVLGALLGAAAGGNNKFNSRVAGVGAISGGVGAAAEAEGGQRGIIRRCLMGRGYSVLN